MTSAGPSGASCGAQTYSPVLSVGAIARIGRSPRSTCWANADGVRQTAEDPASNARRHVLIALQHRPEGDDRPALVDVVEEVAVVVVDLEVAPARPDAHLVVDLIVDRPNPLPGEVGASDD